MITETTDEIIKITDFHYKEEKISETNVFLYTEVGYNLTFLCSSTVSSIKYKNGHMSTKPNTREIKNKQMKYVEIEEREEINGFAEKFNLIYKIYLNNLNNFNFINYRKMKFSLKNKCKQKYLSKNNKNKKLDYEKTSKIIKLIRMKDIKYNPPP
jgi:hypothetical protein